MVNEGGESGSATRERGLAVNRTQEEEERSLAMRVRDGFRRDSRRRVGKCTMRTRDNSVQANYA